MRITARFGLFIPFLAACSGNPIQSIGITDTVKNPILSAPVDVVRDQYGVPHIYGQTPADVAFAEGYVMAEDRLVQMDLARHQAAGTLAELVGGLSPSVIDDDINMRVHHLSSTAESMWQTLQKSSMADDQQTTQMLTKFAAGVNAYVADLNDGKYSLPPQLVLFYTATTFQAWKPEDSLMLGCLQAFDLAYDSDSDIYRTQLSQTMAMVFDQSTNPSNAARAGIGDDFQILAPQDPTYTLPGVDKWTGMNGDTSRASLMPNDPDGNLYAVMTAARKSQRGLGHDAQTRAGVGSNDWVIGPSLSANGHAMVANDTHLSLSNPPIFYLVHLSAQNPQYDVMGVQFAGIPGVILGMNQHVAWGSTVNYIDVTDVYQETVVPCDADASKPCVLFNGAQVALVERDEKINVGRFGNITSSITAVLWDVPQHGPILPRIDPTTHLTGALNIQPNGGSELSVKYTGHEPAPRLATVLYDLATAKTVKDAVAGIDSGFLYGNQNWVIADDGGHIGWTQFTRTPRRTTAAPPWKILPGDGTAEWGADMDPKYIPHAYDPQKAFIATANNDPIGVSDDGDPFFDEPVVDGAPLYLGSDYDPGTRVGRITKRITAESKLSLDDMQSIQADAISEWAQALYPTFMDAAKALQEELATPGSHPDLTGIVSTADAPSKALAPMAASILANWTFDTPDGLEDNNGSPTAQQIKDSQAATVFMVWMRRFADRTFEDELTEVTPPMGPLSYPSAFAQLKLLVRMCDNSPLLHTQISSLTGDPILFDIVDTPEPETKIQMAAQAILDTMDYLAAAEGMDPTQWRWGKIHTLTLQFLAPMDSLQIPLASDPKYPMGFPRHGDIGTVDAAGDFLDIGGYTYDHGPAIRFVAEMDPKNGPQARNVLPGGEVLDPASPHYRDQMELWRHNQTFNLAFTDSDVAAAAKIELMKNGDGRVHFTPK
jgi:penicillin G amidase